MPDPVLFRLSAYNHYFYGEPELHLLRWLCDAKKTALDVGANIGSYTYFMRRYARHVYAYEPIPELATRLARLLPDVTVRCAAVSDAPGALTLRIPVKAGHPLYANASVIIRFHGLEVQEHSVPALRIDDEETGEIGFIKIDVEQHELSVLRGAMTKIRHHRPSIMTEVCPLLYERELPDMFDFLAKESYKGFFRFRGSFMPFSQFSQDTHASGKNYGGENFMANNVIFLPEEKGAGFLRSNFS